MHSGFVRPLRTLLFAVPLACSSQSEDSKKSAPELAKALGEALATACPVTDPASPAARESCAKELAELELLRTPVATPLRWGGQRSAGDFDLARSSTTLFDPYVFRRLYLSTYMFTGDYRVDQDVPRTILKASVIFRGNLDPGDYPYPFWHS